MKRSELIEALKSGLITQNWQSINQLQESLLKLGNSENLAEITVLIKTAKSKINQLEEANILLDGYIAKIEENKTYSVSQVQDTITFNESKQRYEKSIQGKIKLENIIECLNKEVKEVFEEVLRYLSGGKTMNRKQLLKELESALAAQDWQYLQELQGVLLSLADPESLAQMDSILKKAKDLQSKNKIEQNSSQIDNSTQANINSTKLPIINLSDPLPQKPKQEITICFVGKTGSGKSTLINAFYNWCLGVEGKEKTERKYCISTRSISGKDLKAEKQFSHLNTENTERARGGSNTTSPSKYTFHTPEIILHIIDTPGFADTTGLETDSSHQKKILQHITTVNQVNIFGIVWHEKRLTAEQSFVVGCLKELLPKDRYENLVICVTNTLMVDADTKDAIAEAGLEKCPVICFDNLWVTSDEWDRVSRMYRTEANESFEELIRYAKSAEPISSNIFKEVLAKRKQLEISRTNIYENIINLNNQREALKDVIRQLDDLSKDIKNIKTTYTRVSSKDTPEKWNTICTSCGSNCHIGCGLNYKQQDLSGCSAMNSNGICNKCGHRYTVHTHECTQWHKEPITEEITDDENMKKKQSKEQDMFNRNKIKQNIQQKINSLDTELETQVKNLRFVVDELSEIVMAPFNPYYVDYLETLKANAKQLGDRNLAAKLDEEIKKYTDLIERIQSGVKSITRGISNLFSFNRTTE